MSWKTHRALLVAGALCLAAFGSAHAQTPPQTTVQPSTGQPELNRNPLLGDPGARSSAKPPSAQERASDAIVAPNGTAPERAQAGGGGR